MDSGASGSANGVGPWPGGPGEWPRDPADPDAVDPRFDQELLADGDRRNVEDRYRYWTMDAIRADVAARALPFEVAIENLGHDFNIGSIVRTANALGARRVHIVGRRRWNRRGAMVTDRYLDVRHHPDAEAFAADVRARSGAGGGAGTAADSGARGFGDAGRRIAIIGFDNVPGSEPLETAFGTVASAGSGDSAAGLPTPAVLVFGEESDGLSADMLAACDRVLHITQRGSTRSMNVGHAAAIAMWAWVAQNGA